MTFCNASEFSVLVHTQKNGRFNGETAEVKSLVEKGLLKNIGRPSWVPEDYFVLTEEGKGFLKAFQDKNKLSIEI